MNDAGSGGYGQRAATRMCAVQAAAHAALEHRVAASKAPSDAALAAMAVNVAGRILEREADEREIEKEV